MDNEKNDHYYILKIRQDLEFIVVHDYGNVDLNVVYETLKNDIPDLLEIFSEYQ